MDEVEERSFNPCFVHLRYTEQNNPYSDDDVINDDFFDIEIGKGANASCKNRQDGDDAEQFMRKRYVHGEEQRICTDDRIYTDLCQQSSKQRKYRNRRRIICTWKPEIKREDSCFKSEDHKEHYSNYRQDTGSLNLRNLYSQVSHIKSAGHRIQISNSSNKKCRRNDVYQKVFNGFTQLRFFAAMNDQHIGRHEQHFEE